MNDFELVVKAQRDARKRLATEERALRSTGRAPEDRAERRQRRREKLIDLLAPGRRCHGCARVYAHVRRWQISRDPRAGGRILRVQCIACARKAERMMRSLHVRVPVAITTPEQPRFRVNPRMLRLAREQTGLSVEQLAMHMQWSRSYAAKLEAGGQSTISWETRDMLIRLLKHFGAQLQDANWELRESERPFEPVQLWSPIVPHGMSLADQLKKKT